jgi:hypothetical protein
MFIIIYRLLFTFSYGLTRVISLSFLACSFFLRIFSNSHKSNFSLYLGLQVIFKSKLGVKQNDLCLWSSWYYFTRWIVHQTRLGLPLIIFITTSWISSTHVVTSIHDLGIDKSPCIFHSKTKQTVCFFSFLFFFSSYQIFNDIIKFHNIIEFHNTKNIDSGLGNKTNRCRIRTCLGPKYVCLLHSYRNLCYWLHNYFLTLLLSMHN